MTYASHRIHAPAVARPKKVYRRYSYEERLIAHMAEERKLLVEQIDTDLEQGKPGWSTLSAIDVANPHPKGCFHCGQKDHLSCDCPLLGVPYS